MQNAKNQIRTRRQGDTPFFPNMLNNGKVEVCLKEDVDATIAELKQKLKDAGVHERRLKRALWIAHAYKAKFKRWWLHLALDCEASAIRPDTKTINRIKGKIGNCEKSERKCRDKAEEYNV